MSVMSLMPKGGGGGLARTKHTMAGMHLKKNYMRTRGASKSLEEEDYQKNARIVQAEDKSMYKTTDGHWKMCIYYFSTNSFLI
jgi:hypothetical protein